MIELLLEKTTSARQIMDPNQPSGVLEAVRDTQSSQLLHPADIWKPNTPEK